MHELVVTQTILQLALDHTPPNTRITDLQIVLGELSSFVDDSVQFYWDILAAGTAAEGATLHFERKEARMICDDCGAQYNPRQTLLCPNCSAAHGRLVSGEEAYLASIEVQPAVDVVVTGED